MYEYAEASIAVDELKIIEDSKSCLKVQAVISKSGVYDYPQGPTLKPASELLKGTRTARYAKLAITEHPDTLVIMRPQDLFGGVEKPFWDRNKMKAILNFDKGVTPKTFLERVREAASGGAPLNASIGFYHRIEHKSGMAPDVNTGEMRKYIRIMRDFLIDHVAVGDFKGRCRAPICGIGVGVDAFLQRLEADIVGRRGDEWCVFHCNPDGSRGGVIKCFSGPDAHARANAMHRAIMVHKHKSADFYLDVSKLADVMALDDSTFQLLFGIDEKPPKQWMENCMEKAEGFAKSAGAFCMWLWNNGPEALKKSFGALGVSTIGGKSMEDDQEETPYEKCIREKKAEGMTDDEAKEACKGLKPEAAQEGEKTKTPWQLCIQKHMAEGLTKEQARMKCKEEGVVQTSKDKIEAAQEQKEAEALEACIKSKMEIEGMTREEAEEACKPTVDQGEIEEPAPSQEELPTPLEQCVANRMEATGEGEAAAIAWCKDELAGLHEPAEKIVDKIADLQAKDEMLSRRGRH